jgi:hypothetical protein
MNGWSRRLAGALVAAAAGAAVPASAQPAAPRAAVWVASGAFLPADDVYEEAYGQPQWPLIVQGDVRVGGPLWVFAGARRLARDGRTVTEAPTTIDVSYPLELRATSFRFGAAGAVRLARADVVLGVGVERLSGEERWPTADLSSDVDTWGVLVQGSLRIPIWRHVGCLGLIEYSRFTTQQDEHGLVPVDVGGITLGGGVLFRF